MWKPFPVDGNGAAEGIRTPNPQIRSLMLYPIELRNQLDNRRETNGLVDSVLRHPSRFNIEMVWPL